MSETQKNGEKSISERLDEILAKLSKDQIRFVVALQDYPTKKDAAQSIGIQPNTVYGWNGEIDEAVQLMAQERLEAAQALRRHALMKAIAVKIAGLDSDNELVRQKAATEIIEWELGKANQPLDISGNVDINWDEHDND